MTIEGDSDQSRENLPLDIIFYTLDLSKNSLGRTYCLWQLATALGWTSTVVSLHGDEVWKPLRDTPFAAACVKMTVDELERSKRIKESDLFIAIKPLESSFGLAMAMSSKLGIPLLLDVDDPDLDAHLSWARPHRRIAKQIVRPKALATAKRLRAAAGSFPTIVSNPVLQARYSGSIIPHIREDIGTGNPHVSEDPTVAFVGSNQAHKGLDLLREAVAAVQDLGYKLVITDTAPPDARPWERWIGATSLSEGLGIVAESDVVVLPSLNLPYANGQLPAKLIDAMLLGRALAVSNIEPMPWAIGGHGMVFEPGSARAIESSLRELANPELRTKLGEAARKRALELFVVASNSHVFEATARAASRMAPLPAK